MITTLLSLYRMIAKVNDVFGDLATAGKHTKTRKEYHAFKHLAKF